MTRRPGYSGAVTDEQTTPDTAVATDTSQAEVRKRRLLAVSIQLVATAVAFAVLKRTPDGRLRGPRWLWQLIVPMTFTKTTGSAIVVAPLGPILFFIFGRRSR